MVKPHDLVTALAKAMTAKGGPLEAAKTLAGASPANDGERLEVLDASPDRPELVTFAGYLGGKIRQPGGDEWRLLYLDWQLQNWLLVEDEGIVYDKALDDDKSPFNKRDVIWVNADAGVGRGSGSQSVQAQFLSGEFTRAGDFDAPLMGGTTAASTGVFCEATTPSCCRRLSQGSG